jgi:hypothetical protein
MLLVCIDLASMLFVESAEIILASLVAQHVNVAS